MNKLDVKTRKQINAELYTLSKIYYNDIPIDSIKRILKCYDMVLLQEDNTEFDGFFCGENSHTTFNLASKSTGLIEYIPYDNVMLIMSWYKLQSGRYEINLYLS